MQLYNLDRIEINLQKIQHLCIAVLLDHVDPIMPGYEIVNLLRKGVGPDAKIIDWNLAFAIELVTALDHRKMARAEGNDSDFLLACAFEYRFRNQRLRGLKLASQPQHVVFVILGTLRIQGLLIVAGAAGEVCGSRMVRAGKGTIWDPVPVHVLVTGKPSKLFELFSVEHLAAIDRLFRILEGLRHPVVHAQIKVR